MLSDAIDDFAATTAARPGSVAGGDTIAILHSYAIDHLVEIADPKSQPPPGLDDGERLHARL